MNPPRQPAHPTRAKKTLATSPGLAYLQGAMQDRLPEITVDSKIALVFRGKREQWTIKQIAPALPLSAVDLARRGWESKDYFAERDVIGAQRATRSAHVLRNATTGDFEICTLL